MIRVNGPYERGALWRLVATDADGTRHTHSYDTESEANEARREYEQELAAEHWLPGVTDALASSAQPLPTEPRWVYFLRGADGTVVYVGQSGSLTDRLYEHRKRGIEFATASYLPQALTTKQALHIERVLVRHLRPRFNLNLQDGNFVEK